MFERLFGRRPPQETPKPADSFGLGASPDHVQSAFRAPNVSGVGFDKGSWGSQDTAGTAPVAPQPESPRAALDQPMADYLAAEEAPPGAWINKTPQEELVEIDPGSFTDTSHNNQDDEQMAAK